MNRLNEKKIINIKVFLYNTRITTYALYFDSLILGFYMDVLCPVFS